MSGQHYCCYNDVKPRCLVCVAGLKSYRRTEMNLRGLSYWMLPSQPVSRLGYSRLATVRSQQLVPGGASISLTSQRASPSPSQPATISCLDLSSEPGSRLSESNDAFARHASEELTPPHARKAAASALRYPGRLERWVSYRLGVSQKPAEQRQSAGLHLCVLSWRSQLWSPCATLRIVINTAHCGVDAPS